MEDKDQIQRNFQIMAVFMHARASKAPYHWMRVKSLNHSVRYKVSHYTHKAINKPITQFSTGATISVSAFN